MARPITLSVTAARRFAVRTQRFDSPLPDVDSALAYFGYVQIDPLNICGRMHDLILRNRVREYREGELLRHVHGAPLNDEAVASEATPTVAAAFHASEKRTAFEHHMPDTSSILVVFPVDAWPHLRSAMHRRTRSASAWSGRLTPTERKLAPLLLAEIASRGPMTSQDFDDDRRARRVVWGKSSLVKSVLQKLFFHGELLIAGRSKHRRLYDLAERVVPAAIRNRPDVTDEETARWLAWLKLRQRRLVALKRAEIPLVDDVVQPIAVPGCPTLYCLRSDVAELDGSIETSSMEARNPPGADEAGDATRASPRHVRLLAPLDPLIYDRRLTASLWNFEYTWEAYTPAVKRVRGHYALPVLDGLELVGHVEPKADRDRGKLVVASRAVRRGTRVAPALDELASWLGLRR